MKITNTNINFHVIKNKEWMEEILVLLQRKFNIVSAEQLEDYYYKGVPLKNACHITVDDGDMSVYTHLFPLIKKYNIPISIYISPFSVKTGKNFWFQEFNDIDYKDFLKFYADQIGKKIAFENKEQVSGMLKSMKVTEINALIEGYKRKYNIPFKERLGMSLDQLLELKDSGLVSIGAHTMNHPILKNEDDETARKEILDSIEELQEMLQEEVRYFAYPNGIPGFDFGKREMDILKEAGIKLAFSTESKHFSQEDNPLSVPRRGITKGGKVFVLTKLYLGNYWDMIKKLTKGKQEMDFRGN